MVTLQNAAVFFFRLTELFLKLRKVPRLKGDHRTLGAYYQGLVLHKQITSTRGGTEREATRSDTENRVYIGKKRVCKKSDYRVVPKNVQELADSGSY